MKIFSKNNTHLRSTANSFILMGCLIYSNHSQALMKKSESFYQNVRTQILDETSVRNNNDNSSILAVIRLDYASLDVVPPEIKNKTALNKSLLPNKGISVYVSLTNDYNFLRIVGLKNTPDDYGDTHGTKAAIGGYLPNGMYMTLEASTHLYTDPIGEQLKKSVLRNTASISFLLMKI